MSKLLERYLGDGVYATALDDGSIVLDLRAQEPTPTNAIVLEPQVLGAFEAFQEAARDAYEEAQRQALADLNARQESRSRSTG